MKTLNRNGLGNAKNLSYCIYNKSNQVNGTLLILKFWNYYNIDN